MLINPTIEKLQEMNLKTMAKALREIDPSFYDLEFNEQFGILVEKEWIAKKNARIDRFLKSATFSQNACIEDIDYAYKKAKEKAIIQKLSFGTYIDEHLNVIISGMTGSGKTYLSCALGNAACRGEHKVKYYRMPEMLIEISHSKLENAYSRFMNRIKKYQLLIIDDVGLQSHSLEESRDFLEVVEARYNKGSLILSSQLPHEKWYDLFPDPTIADAIMDRVSYNSYIINLESKISMRQIIAEKKMKFL